MGEHGVSVENMENIENGENMEKMENINQMTWNTLFMIQNHLFVTQKNIFGLLNTLFFSFNVDGRKKIVTYVLQGEHNSGLAQYGRTLSKMWNPGMHVEGPQINP